MMSSSRFVIDWDILRVYCSDIFIEFPVYSKEELELIPLKLGRDVEEDLGMDFWEVCLVFIMNSEITYYFVFLFLILIKFLTIEKATYWKEGYFPIYIDHSFIFITFLEL